VILSLFLKYVKIATTMHKESTNKNGKAKLPGISLEISRGNSHADH